MEISPQQQEMDYFPIREFNAKKLLFMLTWDKPTLNFNNFASTAKIKINSRLHYTKVGDRTMKNINLLNMIL